MRSIFLCILTLVLLAKPIYAAQPSIVEAEGYACMGDDKSRKQTEQAALIDAKKKAVEFVSTQIRSETQINNFELENDVLASYANADVKILKELVKNWFTDPTNGSCYKIIIRAEVIPNTSSSVIQEDDKCSRWSTEFFQREFKSSDSSLHSIFADFANERCIAGDICDFQSHYNKQQSKCFILVKVEGAIPTELNPSYRIHLLYDAYKRLDYGVYWGKQYRTGDEEIINCWLKDKFGITPLSKPPACKSGYEFDSAINPYMSK